MSRITWRLTGGDRAWLRFCWTHCGLLVSARCTTPVASSWNRKRIVDRFADPRAQITTPCPWNTAVHDTGDEAELLCHVAAVLANVVSAGCGVLVHEFTDVGGFGKEIGRAHV